MLNTPTLKEDKDLAEKIMRHYGIPARNPDKHGVDSERARFPFDIVWHSKCFHGATNRRSYAIVRHLQKLMEKEA
jgi:hypothetical protein